MKVGATMTFLLNLGRFRSIFHLLRGFKAHCEDHVFPRGIITAADDAFIHPSVNFRSPEKIVIGCRTRIQPGVLLWASPNSRIVIGDGSGVGPGAMFFSSNHAYRFGSSYIDQPWVEKDIVVGRNVWIGAGCILTAGVKIGDGSVVAAGSVVTRDIPPGTLAAGIPARVVRSGVAAMEQVPAEAAR